MKRLSFKDLQDGKTYTATDKDGRKHSAIYTDSYGGVVFCCYPAFTDSGEKNELVYYEEVKQC